MRPSPFIAPPSIAQRVALLREDLPALRDQADGPLLRLARQFRAGMPADELVHLLPWRSPAGNEWLLLLRYHQDRPALYTMAWYHDSDGRMGAFWLAAQGMAFHFAPQFMEHYALADGLEEDGVERLQSFFLEHAYFVAQAERPGAGDSWVVSMDLTSGKATGSWDMANDVVEVHAFHPHRSMTRDRGHREDRAA